MTTSPRPRRRHSPAVYRRRRLTVLLVLVLLVVLVVWAVRSCAAGGEPTSASASPVATASPAPTAGSTADAPQGAATTGATATPSEPATPTSTDTGTPVAAASAGPWTGADCSLRVVATTDRTSYPAGTTPTLGLKITNTDTAGCVVDVGTAYQRFVVRSGKDRVWASSDCQTNAATDLRTLPGGASVTAEMPWSRVRSAKGCPTGLATPAAGTYTLRVSLGSVTSKPVVFQLR